MTSLRAAAVSVATLAGLVGLLAAPPASAASSISSVTVQPGPGLRSGPGLGAAARTTVAPDGTRFNLLLAAGPVRLPAAGGTVRVLGHGYDERQGIVLAFCVVPDGVRVGDPSTYGTAPSTCLPGRATRDGSSRRITNAATGTPGITIPYAAGGSFATTLNIRPQIAEGVVCGKQVRCAIVTRADFTALGVRAFDQYIPVRFDSAAAG